MILHRNALSSRRYRSDESDEVAVEIRWSRSLGGFTRDGEILVDGRLLEMRTEGSEVWLIEDETSIAYARGRAMRWEFLFGERNLLLIQPSLGKPLSDLSEDGHPQGQIRAADRLLRKVLVNVSEEFDATQQVFLAAIAIRGWRETLAGMSTSVSG